MDQEIKQEFETLSQVVKDSFQEIENKMATKEDLKDLKNWTEKRFDSAEKRFDSIESHLFEIQRELEDIRKRLEALEKRTLEDVDAVAKDLIKLKERVDVLEVQIRQMQTSQT